MRLFLGVFFLEAPKSRWTTDPGAIPGEPYDYLDIPIGEQGEIGEAKAVIVEIETPVCADLFAVRPGSRT